MGGACAFATEYLILRARLGDSKSGRYPLEEKIYLTKHVVAAGSFAKDPGSTPGACAPLAEALTLRARLGVSVSGRYRPEENSLLTKHVVAAGNFAKDAGSTPAASTI